MKLKTVNVIEQIHSSIQSLRSFGDDKNGNIQAEVWFEKLAKEHGAKSREIDGAIDDGFWDDGNGYMLYLVHSTDNS